MGQRVRPMMRTAVAIALAAAVSPPAAAPAAAQATASANSSVTVEYYYRIRWGSAPDFKRLYDRNHAPLLAAMQKAGFIRSIRVEEPFTHMAGGPRWDLRVTIAFRDAAAAVNDPEWERLWEAERKRLFPDRAAFEAEETRRFAMLEDHWDIIVNSVAP